MKSITKVEARLKGPKQLDLKSKERLGVEKIRRENKSFGLRRIWEKRKREEKFICPYQWDWSMIDVLVRFLIYMSFWVWWQKRKRHREDLVLNQKIRLMRRIWSEARTIYLRLGEMPLFWESEWNEFHPESDWGEKDWKALTEIPRKTHGAVVGGQGIPSWVRGYHTRLFNKKKALSLVEGEEEE